MSDSRDDKPNAFHVGSMKFEAGQVYVDDAGNKYVVSSAVSSIATCPCGDILAIQEKKCDRADCPVVAKSPSAIERRPEHSLAGELDTKLLGAFTPAKTMAPGFELEYWNLTMVRMKGDVVLTVRLPSKFSHYVETPEGRMAAWHPGAVSSVRFTRDLWPSFVKQIGEADKVFQACDSLDAI